MPKGLSVSVARLGLGVFAAVVLSCAPTNSGSTAKPTAIKECVLPADQSATLSSYWPVLPVPIAFKDGDFSDSEMEAILDAADTWNAFFEESRGYPVFNYGSTQAPNVSAEGWQQSTLLCGRRIVAGGVYSGQVVIFKHLTWPYPAEPDAIAVTRTCFDDKAATVIKPAFMAMVELNYENFFVDGQKKPDLRSIALHELGHLLGLGHSCEDQATPGIPNCDQSAYFDAVMYWSVLWSKSGIAERRRSLASNDQGRANCLYGTK